MKRVKEREIRRGMCAGESKERIGREAGGLQGGTRLRLMTVDVVHTFRYRVAAAIQHGADCTDTGPDRVREVR